MLSVDIDASDRRPYRRYRATGENQCTPELLKLLRGTILAVFADEDVDLFAGAEAQGGGDGEMDAEAELERGGGGRGVERGEEGGRDGFEGRGDVEDFGGGERAGLA